MNYFQFHLGDYAKKTMHLTLVEDAIYMRLLRLYYDTEKPLPSDVKTSARLAGARSAAEIEAAEAVLNDFFTLTDEGWRNKRADEEIAKHKQAKASHWGAKLTKAQRCHIQANRNAAKLNATPSWLSKAQHEEIASIYAKAALRTAETGIKHEVDHVIPLRGKLVCGLHAPWNLRVIEAYKNRQKSNLVECNL
jgi:uncharacterized protein YdaU (DUF1376 family)